MTSAEFLFSVWRVQKGRGYVFVSYKTEDGSWHDVPVVYPTTVDAVEKVLNKVGKKGARDLYFCPNIFKKPKRRREFALPSVWLYADLDPVDPDKVEPAPTTAVRTSPSRFQCMWRVNRGLDERQHATLNQRLTYLTQADKGGWSITKVLRVPMTENFKRGTPTKVKLLWHDLQRYEVKTLVQAVKGVQVSPASGDVEAGVDIPDMTTEAVLYRHRDKLPDRALHLLKAKHARVGERSDRLWELENLVIGAGVPPEEALILVRESVWNKYAGQRRELAQLWAEIQKVVKHHRVETFADVSDLQLTTYGDFIATELPTEVWTVEGIWSHDAHGLIAGEPKTFKSFVATDLAVSVASGTKFLGQFEVPETGPVLMIQEENTPAMMKDRLEKITTSRGIAGGVHMNGSREIEVELPQELPIFLMNNKRFNLTDEEHLEVLESWIKELRPKLVVLDPIYLMMPGVDENSAVGMTPVLRDLLTLKQRYDVGILIVHHYNKPREGEDRHPGNRISGSSVFYRWFESALYLSKGGAPGEVIMTPEHRGAAPQGHIALEFDIGEMGETDYHVDVEIRRETGTGQLRREAIRLVNDRPGITLQVLADELGIPKERTQRLCNRLGFTSKRGKSGGKAGRPPLGIFPR